MNGALRKSLILIPALIVLSCHQSSFAKTIFLGCSLTRTSKTIDFSIDEAQRLSTILLQPSQKMLSRVPTTFTADAIVVDSTNYSDCPYGHCLHKMYRINRSNLQIVELYGGSPPGVIDTGTCAVRDTKRNVI